MVRKRRSFSREFKLEAVGLMTDGGLSVVQTARDLGISESVLGRWKRRFVEDPAEAFPGKGRLKSVGCVTGRHDSLRRFWLAYGQQCNRLLSGLCPEVITSKRGTDPISVATRRQIDTRLMICTAGGGTFWGQGPAWDALHGLTPH